MNNKLPECHFKHYGVHVLYIYACDPEQSYNTHFAHQLGFESNDWKFYKHPPKYTHSFIPFFFNLDYGSVQVGVGLFLFFVSEHFCLLYVSLQNVRASMLHLAWFT